MSKSSVAFTDDQLNRLATARTYNSSTWGDSYGYDPWGNLLSKTVTQGTSEHLRVGVDGSNQITRTAQPGSTKASNSR